MNYHLVNKILFFALFCTIAQAKVTIFAHYFGQPEFIKYQWAFFKKNLLDEYEFIVVEDSKNPEVSKEVERECKKYGIPYTHIPRSVFESPKYPITSSYIKLGSASFECSVATQYIYDNYVVSSKNPCVIMDNDIFLLSPFSIEKYLQTTAFFYHPQNKGPIDYMLPNFLILNPSLMPEKELLNFNMGTILENNTDSGGYTYFYLLKYKNLGAIIPSQYLYDTPSPLKERFAQACPLLFNLKKWSSHYFIDKEVFLHIRMGSNWSNDIHYPQMIKEVTFLFDQLLDDSKRATA